MINRKRLLTFLDNLNYRMVFACLAGYLIIAGIIIGAFDGKVGKSKDKKEEVASATDATTEEVTTEEPDGIYRPTEGYDLSDDEKNTPNVLLLQNDPRWKDAPYGSTGTVGEYGSGPTSLSMAVIYLMNDFQATPPRVAEYSAEAGYYMDQSGTSYFLMTDGCEHYGLQCEWLATDNEERLKAALDQGCILIISVKENAFGDNPTDQYAVIYGYNDEGFLINDPINENHSSITWSFETLEGNIMAVFSMSKDPDYTPSTETTDGASDGTTDGSADGNSDGAADSTETTDSTTE